MNFNTHNTIDYYRTIEGTQYDDGVDTRIMLALDKIAKKIKNTKCVCCGKELALDNADIYDHDGGWHLISAIPKQWISFHCDHCGYDNSLNKLGVDR